MRTSSTPGALEMGRADPKETAELRGFIEDHPHYTGSDVADRVLHDFHHLLLFHSCETGWVAHQVSQFRISQVLLLLTSSTRLVTVYDRKDRMGGLLMHDISNMKLDKTVVQRRIDFMAAEGVVSTS